ncbi:MAG: FAD-dependent oxidoreductase, partial [Sphingomonadaceae bacterium]|nr:FAD-dependent oxidoreductase [Sphingomonadaceae bacterium]
MSVVIVGTGQGGFQAAASLRSDGYEGPVTLVGEEPHAPYQRPPLSKAYLLGKQDAEGLLLRPLSFYAENRIDTLFGETVTAVDRTARRVTLASGGTLPYERLVLATGARVKTLPVPGAELDGIVYLRTRDDSDRLRDHLRHANRVVIIGGGYVGLEIAAAARGFGKEVVVLEIEQRLMARSAAPIMSDFYADLHRDRGVDILLGTGAAKIEGAGGRADAVLTSNGLRLPADLVVVGIGVVPNVELAAACDLAIGNGIAVDEYLRTSDPSIYAIGDCCEFPSVHVGARVRLESVQNAVDQARAV